MNTKTHQSFSYRHLSLAVIAVLAQQAWATTDEPSVVLEHETINISAKPKEQVGETIVTRRELNEQMVQNAQDLVRYNTEVDVAEVGRYGNKGFAIRGVDGNRVAMNIDGVALPEVESNEIYSPYGYNYEGRFNPDLEMMRSVRIQAGADSLTSGSGAVGGSVSYMTKMPKDLLQGDNNLGGYAKVGYTSKNEEHMVAVGLAGQVGKFEGLVNYTKRVGHELKNHDMRKHNKERLHSPTYAKEHRFEEIGGCHINSAGQEKECGAGTASLYPDSSRYEGNAVLGKLYYHLNDHHRFGIHGMYQSKDTFSQLTSKNIFGGARYANDSEDMKMYGASYRYTPDNKWLEELALTYTHQEILGISDTKTDIVGTYGTLYMPREYRPTTMDTNQFRLESRFMPLDLGKFGEHQFSTSINYNKVDYTSAKVAFWRNGFGNITDAYQPDLLPFPDAKKDSFNITLSDKIYFNDRFNALLGVRYDWYKYAPYFQDTIYEPDADGDSSEIGRINKRIQQTGNKPDILSFYNNYRNGVYNQKPKFDKLTYGGQFEFAVIPDRLTTRYKVGTGFLAPTITQMYSAFQGQKVQQIINTNLKPETSLNQEVEFEFNLDPVTLTLSAYRSDYKNFIHSKWWHIDTKVNSDCYNVSTTEYCIQSINLDDAKVEGYKVGMRADLSKYLQGGSRLYLTADYHASKDEATYEADKPEDGKLKINTLASVPTTLILGMDYHLPNDKATLHIKARHLKAKKPEDTKMVDVYYPEGSNTYRERVTTYRFADKSRNAIVLDVYGSYKINDNLKINAGVYNLSDEKYIPWDSLRQFATTNINSYIGGKEGYGLNRYTAPGRNYAVALTYEF